MNQYSDCYIAFAGSAWHKSATAGTAIRGVITETAYEDVRNLSVWRIEFPQPVDGLECVDVDAIGSVSYPTGSMLTKFERLPIPPVVASAAQEFEATMTEWHDDVLDEMIETPIPA